jgi:hypothetical protein
MGDLSFKIKADTINAKSYAKRRRPIWKTVAKVGAAGAAKSFFTDHIVTCVC